MASKRFHYFLPIAIGALMLLYALARLTGIFNVHSLPTVSMEPNFPKGRIVFSSSLVRPEMGDVAVYHDTCLAIPGVREAKVEPYMGRIVAAGGDSFEIKKGQTFVNGVQTLAGLRVYYRWMAATRDLDEHPELLAGIPEYLQERFSGDNKVLTLDETAAEKIKQQIRLRRMDDSLGPIAETNPWHPGLSQWTLDHFGPVLVPQGHFFILGDNRHNSEDSRFRGFIPENDIKAKVIFN